MGMRERTAHMRARPPAMRVDGGALISLLALVFVPVRGVPASRARVPGNIWIAILII